MFFIKSRSVKFEHALIKQVRMNPCLYERKLKMYRDTNAKAETWKKIAAVLNKPVVECHGRWRSLRDRFVREVQRVKLLTEMGEEVKNKWRFYEVMYFLKPFLHASRKKYVLHKYTEVRKGEEDGEEEEDEETTEANIDEQTDCDYTQFNSPKRKQSHEDTDSHEESIDSPHKSKYQKFEEFNSPKSTVQKQSSKANFDLVAVDPFGNTENSGTSYEEEPTTADTIPRDRTDHREVRSERNELARLNKKLETALKCISQYLIYKADKANKKSPNAAFLTMLDDYLMRLSDERRESMKMKILNNVYNKIYEPKSNCKNNESKRK